MDQRRYTQEENVQVIMDENLKVHTEIKRNFEILGNQIVDWRLADLRNKEFVWI